MVTPKPRQKCVLPVRHGRQSCWAGAQGEPRRGNRGKRRLANLIVAVLVLLGAVLLVSPYVCFRIAAGKQSHVVQQYDDSLARMEEKAILAELDRARQYNAALPGNPLYDPFASARDGMDAEYRSLLDISGTGVMCRVRIPKIQADLPVFHGVAADVLEKGAGHLEGSSLPVGGAGTHAVLTGHTGLNTAKLFTDLAELVAGDEFYLYTLGQILAYRIEGILVVEPTDVETLLPVAGRDYVTLVTCTPYGVNSHRLLVRGERIDFTPEEIEQRIAETKPVTSKEALLLYAGGALLILLILAVLFLRWRGRRRKKAPLLRGRLLWL